ncbi:MULTISPECIES: hypothetical protein [unclassified Streptomyces]|uniref:hypothetical protein n=1 Tax=unclassified Streptomyces TaxID=2593676 RepID=UPI0035D7EB4F
MGGLRACPVAGPPCRREVAAALGERSAARPGRHPYGYGEGNGGWIPLHDRFDRAGVSAHSASGAGRAPAPGAVTVDGRDGPQVTFDGLRLIGRSVEAVDKDLLRYLEEHDRELVIGRGGAPGPDGPGMYVRATRAGDTVISGARFCRAGREDHG